MIKIFIPADALAAISHFSAEKDIRYYLNGVYVEAGPKGTRLIATNGHVLAVYRCDPSSPEHVGFLIPAFTVAAVLKAKKPFYMVDYASPDTIGIDGHTFADTGSEKFPDYRRVIPMNVSDEGGNFNFEYLARFLKAARSLGVGLPEQATVLRQNGPDKAAVVQIAGHPNFVGVIMPAPVYKAREAQPLPMWVGEKVA